MYKNLTCIDLDITREPGTKKGRKHAYIETVPKLKERFFSNGFARDDYRLILSKNGIDASQVNPTCCSQFDIDAMDSETVLALIQALIEKEDIVQNGFLAACVRSELVARLLGRLEEIDWETRKIPDWINDAANKALADLKDFPKDQETTPYRAIEPYLHYIDKNGKEKIRGLSQQDEFDIVDALDRHAKDHGLYLDSSAYENKVIGLPINIPFRVCKVEVGQEEPRTLMAFHLSSGFIKSPSFTLKRYADCIEAEYHLADPMSERKIVEADEHKLKQLQDCLDSIEVNSWSEEYSAPVLDGWNWSLFINTDDLSVKSHGYNAAPAGFDAFIECLSGVFGCQDFLTFWDSE